METRPLLVINGRPVFYRSATFTMTTTMTANGGGFLPADDAPIRPAGDVRQYVLVEHRDGRTERLEICPLIVRQRSRGRLAFFVQTR